MGLFTRDPPPQQPTYETVDDLPEEIDPSWTWATLLRVMNIIYKAHMKILKETSDRTLS